MATVIYRPTLIETVETAGTGAFVIVGGNPGAVIDDDPNSYVDWTWNEGTGQKGLKFHFSDVTWPAQGFVNFVFKGYTLDQFNPNVRGTIDPYPPNAGYNIDASYARGVTVVQSPTRDLLGATGPALNTDERVNGGEGVHWQTSYPLSEQPTGYVAAVRDGYALLSLAFWPGSAQFPFRISEVYLEVNDTEPGPGGGETGGPGQIKLATTGFCGESIYSLGVANTASNRYGEVETGIVGCIHHNNDPYMELIWADGTRVGNLFGEHMITSYKNGRGASYVRPVPFPGASWAWINGFGLLTDPAGKQGVLIYDYDGNQLNSPVNEWQLYRGYVSKTGEVTNLEAIYTVPWGSDGDEHDWFVPETGGVYNGVATYLSSGGGGAEDTMVFYASQLVELDLTTGDATILGQDDDWFTQTGKPFDWLWTRTVTGLSDTEQTYVQTMCVDPRDGTYWFLCLIANGIEWTTDHWSSGILIFHTERDSSVIDRYFTTHGRWGNSNLANGSIAVGQDGRIYFWSSLDIEVIPGDYNGDYDEYDAVWVFDPADAVADSVVTVDGAATKRVEMSARDNIYFSTGIWAIETDVQVPLPTGEPPLRMIQRDDELGIGQGHARMRGTGARNKPTSYQYSARIMKNIPKGYK